MYSPAQWFDVLLRGDDRGQVVLNHFYYGTSELGLPYGGPIGDVANDFITIVLPKIVAITSSFVTYTQVSVSEHVSSFRVVDVPITSGGQGVRTGEATPTFNAWAYKSQRFSREVPSAHKRFAGIAESDNFSGVPSGSIVADLNALASILGAIFDSGNGGTTDMVPLAISRIDTTVTPHVSRPSPVFDFASVWAFQKITSQVSRRA